MKIFILTPAFSAFIFNKVQHAVNYPIPLLVDFDTIAQKGGVFTIPNVNRFKDVLSFFNIGVLEMDNFRHYSLSVEKGQVTLRKGVQIVKNMNEADFRKKLVPVAMDPTIQTGLKRAIASSNLSAEEKESFYEKVLDKDVELSSNDKNELVISYTKFNGIEAAITLTGVLFIGGSLYFLPKMNAGKEEEKVAPVAA